MSELKKEVTRFYEVLEKMKRPSRSPTIQEAFFCLGAASMLIHKLVRKLGEKEAEVAALTRKTLS